MYVNFRLLPSDQYIEHYIDEITWEKIAKKFVVIETYYVSLSVFPIYLSHFSSEWTEIWHDDSLDGIDRA